MLDALVSVVRTGCQWRFLPAAYPPWSTVYGWFRRGRLDGTWERVPTARREQRRRVVGRDQQPSAALSDRQSVTTTSIGGVHGDDGAKTLSGRQRHVLVDPQGLVLRATVHRAARHDRAGVPLRRNGAAGPVPRVVLVWADHGSTGSGKAWIEEHLGWRVQIVPHPARDRGEGVPLGPGSDPRPYVWRRLPPAPNQFRGILPRRWVVERTFRWFAQSRRLSTAYERRCTTSEAMIDAPLSRLLLRRLARA